VSRLDVDIGKIMAASPWEDNILERKLESDLKDLLKTLVAFSNSVQPGHKAILLIGENNDGTIQGVTNPDNIQKQVRKESEKIYPPILCRSIVYKKKGKYCVRVEVEYYDETPHFGGPAWVRKGSESIIASDETFQRLIDLRSGIVRELSKWLNREVTIHGDPSTIPVKHRDPAVHYSYFDGGYLHRWKVEETAKIVGVNSFWVTFEEHEMGENISEPLRKITLSYDDKNDRLKVIIDY
jgi:hypothetical protein